MLYGEYRFNREFQRGFKRIRNNGASEFRIETNNAIHKFKKIGDNLVQRKSLHKRSGGYGFYEQRYYVYYTIKGRRICPLHLKKLISDDFGEWDRCCPEKNCDYGAVFGVAHKFDLKSREELTVT